MQSALRSVPGDIRATIVRLLAYMGSLAILAIAAARFFSGPDLVAAVHPAAVPEWVNVERPHPAFELQMPELAAEDFDYAILRRTADGARKDILSFGTAAGSGPFVTVEIYRAGTKSEQFIDAPSEIAARIVAYKVVDDVKSAGSIESKFGNVALLRRAGANDAVACLGFFKSIDDPRLKISGFSCQGDSLPARRAAVGCMLDRLMLLTAGNEPKLAELFAHAELRRGSCATQGASGAQADWVTSAENPHLRGPL